MKDQGAKEGKRNIEYPIAFISQTGLSIFSLSIPIFAHELQASSLEVGLVGGSMGILYCFAPAIFGKASDALGRKSLLVTALIIYSCLGIAFPLSRSVFQLVILGTLLGLSNSLLWPSLEALTVDVGRDLEMALRNYNLSWGLGIILGPSIAGGLISLLGIEAPFYFVTSITFPTAILAILILKEPKARIHREDRGRRQEHKEGEALGPRHLIALGVAALQGFFTGILLSIFPAQAVAANVSPWEVGLATLLSGVTRILAFYIVPFMKANLGRPRLLTIGIFLHSVAVLPLSIGFSPQLFYITFLLTGLASGITYAASLATLLEEEGGRGGRAGSFESMIGLGYFLGPVVGGAAADVSPSTPYIVCLGLSLIAGMVQALYLSKG
jgi:MFS family permease